MPTLVDTSVWIQHFRADLPGLHRLLEQDLAVCHPLVIGELACGQLKHRAEVLGSLATLPQAPALESEEILAFLESHKLFGQGLGWIDVHLLASTLLSDVTLWTMDGPLQRVARKLHCSFSLSDS
jgi:predicted nucleic acid-binding protein